MPAFVLRDAEETTNIPNNDKWVASSEEDEFLKNEDVILSSEVSNIHLPNNQAGCTSDERECHRDTFLQDQVSDFTTSGVSHFSDEVTKLSYATSPRKSNSSLHEDKLKDESDHEILFRAAPLSNRERLVLRKQALKMRKRPVLAVGRSNIVTGVAKTIRTHFKKYPLAIVNIKGRAEGTSVQEVIFQLEATGAVLVSREPNKVILYRGWGEGESPLSNLNKDSRKGSTSVDEQGRVSSKLMEAIGLECGLSTNQVDSNIFDM